MPSNDPLRTSVARRRSYSRPPITERIVEVHVIPGPTAPSTLRDAFRGRWTDFPIDEEIGLGTIELQWKVGEGLVETRESSEPRYRFWRDDRKRLLQVSPVLFAANDLLPEPGWEDLLPMFKSGYADFLELVRPRAVVKGVLRYLNRVPLPPGHRVEEIFTIFPKLPERAATNAAAFQMVVDMGNTGAGPALLALAFAGNPAEVTYALDLAVQSGPGEALGTVDEAARWAGRAHDRMTELFESSITSRARELFGERG